MCPLPLYLSLASSLWAAGEKALLVMSFPLPEKRRSRWGHGGAEGQAWHPSPLPALFCGRTPRHQLQHGL